MKLEEKNRSRTLRCQGYSIKQIAETLKVAKGSVSSWVRDIKIPETLIANIENRKRLGREHSRVARLSNIARRNCEVDAKCREEILPLSERDLWIAGIMLYAGEGYKSARVSGQRIELANSDPDILRVFVNFLEKVCLACKQKIKIRLMLYEDINTEEAKRYWSEQLDIPQDQFCRPFIKQSYKNIPFRHLRRSKYGTVHIILCDVVVYRKIIGWMKAVYEFNKLDFTNLDRGVAQFG
ncbi:MAG: hypothetical protein HZB36_06275 [Candidatus Omnitrophica bacterium]|nr:hypothetical protein [Candidatus Omnitrophota bacterium]